MKTIKKIVIVSTKIRGGGAERVVSVLSSALAELGYQVDLILYERYEDEYPVSNSVNIHMLPTQGNHQNKTVYLVKKFIALPMKRAFAPILFVSEISYLLYLTHQFIGFGIIQMMESHGMVAEAWILVPVIHAIVLAAILHYGIELRLNHLLERFSR